MTKALQPFVMAQMDLLADDTSDYHERMMSQNEEELHHAEEANQQIQQTLSQVLSPRVLLLRLSPDIIQGLPQDGPEPPQVKEEPECIKQEEEELPVSIQECTGLCVKTEESSELQQRQSELREETKEENMGSEHHLHSTTEGHKELSSDTDNDDDWEPPGITSAEADGDQQEQVHNRNTKPSSHDKSAAKTCVTVEKGEASGNERGAERNKHLCPFCHKGFAKICDLKTHIRIHTGERPYKCSTCDKTFNEKNNLKAHKRTHTGEKPYRCSTCEKTFTQKQSLEAHKRTHTGEKPYRCSTCDKSFTQKQHLEGHKRTHTGEKPYSCSTCEKSFTQKSNLETHQRTHTGERPYKCSTCDKAFAQKYNLETHKRTHTGEKLFSCTVCNKSFRYKHKFKCHMSSH